MSGLATFHSDCIRKKHWRLDAFLVLPHWPLGSGSFLTLLTRNIGEGTQTAVFYVTHGGEHPHFADCALEKRKVATLRGSSGNFENVRRHQATCLLGFERATGLGMRKQRSCRDRKGQQL
jgi:hypothetical protein